MPLDTRPTHEEFHRLPRSAQHALTRITDKEGKPLSKEVIADIRKERLDRRAGKASKRPPRQVGAHGQDRTIESTGFADSGSKAKRTGRKAG